MFSKVLKRVAGLGGLVMLLSVMASAQTTQLEGSVKVKNADGTTTPVVGAIIDIYRLDVKGHWEIKTDKSGHYIRIGLPIQGTALVVASGPGMTPTWFNNIRLAQTPTLDFVANPGDGNRPTLEEVQAAIKGGPAATATRQPSAEDRAKVEAAGKEHEAKVKERAGLQASLDEAIKHFNTGQQLKQANNYEGAVAEFKQAAVLDPGKEKAFVEVTYKSWASLAETQYMLGADVFNKAKKAVPEAKSHFEESSKSVSRAIEIATLDSANPNINNELVIYYNIYAKSVKPLVQFYGNTEIIDEAVKMYDKAAAIDTPNKLKWELMKGELYRLGYKSDEAVAAFKAVLVTDPNNADALYGIGLTLVASGEKAKLQDAANYLADFVTKAPASDPRVAEVQASLQALKAEYKVEAEKPAARRRRP